MKSKKKTVTSPKQQKVKKPTVKTLLTTYWLHLTILTFIAGYGINRQMELRQFAQNCMTRAMVSSDTRCLYIYQNQVYEKDSRNKPHKGNPCGTDVTSFIPSFHFMSAAKYLDPNLVGTLCSDTQPTPIPTATPRPTNTPTMRPLPTNTPVILPSATQTPRPTNTPVATNTPRPTQVPPTPTTVPSPTELPSPTPTPTLPPIATYPTWWNLIPAPLRNYLEQLYYWVFFFRRASDNAQVLEGVFPTPTP